MKPYCKQWKVGGAWDQTIWGGESSIVEETTEYYHKTEWSLCKSSYFVHMLKNNIFLDFQLLAC